MSSSHQKSLVKKAVFWLGDSALWFCVLVGFAWAFGAIWFYALLPEAIRKPMAVAYLAFGIWLIRQALKRETTKAAKTSNESTTRRSKKRWARPALAATVPVFYFATLFVQPSNDRQWSGDQQMLPIVTIDEGRVTIENFRDFRYQTPTDFEPRYKTVSFRLDQLQTVDFIVQRFTKFNGMAHTFLSFGIDSGQGMQYFSVSVEIRKEDHELYSPLAGLFRHYELMYVVGSEEDLVGVRTNIRPDDRIYLFPVNADKEQVEQLFVKFADRIESLRTAPEFYNTLMSNCTNNIVANTWDLSDDQISAFSPRVILPGYSDKLAYNKRLIGKPGQTFEQLKQQCRIDEVARKAGITERFSSDIRANLDQ